MQDVVKPQTAPEDVGFLLRVCPSATPIQVAMEARQQLIIAREILKRPGAWIKNETARDWLGHPCDPRSPEAEKFDLTGALIRARGGVDDNLYGKVPIGTSSDLAMRAALEACGRHSMKRGQGRITLDYLNDYLATDVSAVVAVLNTAISYFDDWFKGRGAYIAPEADIPGD